MAPRKGDAAIGHQDGYLIQRLRVVRPEFNHPGRIGQIGSRVLLLGVNKIWEFERVVEEKYRRVIPQKVKVTLVGIKFHCETTWISGIVAGVLSTTHRGKAHENIGLLPLDLQEICARVFGQCFGQGKRAISARAARVHHPLWNSFTIEVCEFFE